MDDERLPPLSIGSIDGGATIGNRRLWSEAIRQLSTQIQEALGEVGIPLGINVVFQIPGKMIQPDFTGVRTGSYSKQRAGLMVQVALPETPPVDPYLYVRAQTLEAIDEAERWATRRGVPADTTPLRELIHRLADDTPPPPFGYRSSPPVS